MPTTPLNRTTMSKTAVQLAIEKIGYINTIHEDDYAQIEAILTELLQTEKEQIIKAWEDGYFADTLIKSANEYYSETYEQ